MKISKYVEDNTIKLSQVEIRELFNDKENNKNIIIKSQLALALSIADSFSKTTEYTVESLFSEAVMALTSAHRLYDHNHKATFTTYAKTAMTNKLSNIRNEDLIRKPGMNTKNHLIPKTSLFCDLMERDDDGKYDEFDVIDDSDVYESFEDEYVEAVKKYSKNDKGSDIVLRYLGLGYDKAMTFPEIAKLYGMTYQGIRLLYHNEIERLQNNDIFKNKLNKENF